MKKFKEKVKKIIKGCFWFIWKKIYWLFNSIVNLLPIVLLGILLYFFIKIIVNKDLNFEEFIRLIDSTLWPIVFLFAIILFRKIFTYLFFSLEEFNFFGTKGRLNDVREMIAKKAQDLYDKKINDDKIRLERDSFANEIEDLKNKNLKGESLTNKTIEIAEKILDSNEKFEKENIELKRKVLTLSNQIEGLKSLIETESPLINDISEESISVGTTEETKELEQN